MLVLWRICAGHWRRWAWGCLLLGLTNVTTMLTPQLLRVAIDTIERQTAVRQLTQVALVMLLLARGRCGVSFRSAAFISFTQRVMWRWSCAARSMTILPRQPAQFFQQWPTGDLMSRATNDLGQIAWSAVPASLTWSTR